MLRLDVEIRSMRSIRIGCQTRLSSLTEFTAESILINFLGRVGITTTQTDYKDFKLITYPDKKGSYIIGTLWEQKKKSDIMNNFKEMLKADKPILVDQMFRLPSTSPLVGRQIRFKNRLTKINALLLKAARSYKDKLFAFVWESEGRVLIRRSPSEKPIHRKNMEHLRDLVEMK